MKPFLKWAGGKRQLLPVIKKYIPANFSCYHEPFMGAGALLFELTPQKAVINDLNAELINCYQTIAHSVEELIKKLNEHKEKHSEAHFLEVRSLDKTPDFKSLCPIKRAARFIYLNKTCYNGLYRVNKQGQFNVPFGKYKNPEIVNEELLRQINTYLSNNEITITNQNYRQSLFANIAKGDFVYLDPPYAPLKRTSFVGYQSGGFDVYEQKNLASTVDILSGRGCYILLSNSNTEFIRDLYSKYKIIEVEATRNINSRSDDRGKIKELLIMNF